MRQLNLYFMKLFNP